MHWDSVIQGFSILVNVIALVFIVRTGRRMKKAEEIDRRLEAEKLRRQRELKDAKRKHPKREGTKPARIHKMRFTGRQ